MIGSTIRYAQPLFPRAKTVTVDGTRTGSIFTLIKQLGSSSTFSLLSGSHSNLTISGAAILATGALANATQTAIVREQSGGFALEYPVTMIGNSLVSAPINTATPIVSGTATIGQTLSATNGTWSNNPMSYAYVWKRGSTAISGATSSTYQLVSADASTSISCTVTASNSAGSAIATSNTISVAAPPANYNFTNSGLSPGDGTVITNGTIPGLTVLSPPSVGSYYVNGGKICQADGYRPGGMIGRPLGAQRISYVYPTANEQMIFCASSDGLNGLMIQVVANYSATDGEIFLIRVGAGSQAQSYLGTGSHIPTSYADGDKIGVMQPSAQQINVWKQSSGSTTWNLVTNYDFSGQLWASSMGSYAGVCGYSTSVNGNATPFGAITIADA